MWWTVGEVNWLCRQAGRVNKQSTYLDVYELNPKQNKQEISRTVILSFNLAFSGVVIFFQRDIYLHLHSKWSNMIAIANGFIRKFSPLKYFAQFLPECLGPGAKAVHGSSLSFGTSGQLK